MKRILKPKVRTPNRWKRYSPIQPIGKRSLKKWRKLQANWNAQFPL